jgi:HIRAN domain
MQTKRRGGKDAIGELRINLDEGTATLSNMAQSYKVRLVGVTFDNVDGINRQAILAGCSVGDELELVRDLKNSYDTSAIAVCRKGHQLGWLPAGDKRLATHMDAGLEVFAHIVAINGGPSPDFSQRVVRPAVGPSA